MLKRLKVIKSRDYLIGAFFCLALLVILLVNGAGFAKDQPPSISLVQGLEPKKTGLSNPSGVAFSTQANVFYVIEALGGRQVVSDDTVIKNISVLGQDAGSTQIKLAVENPINLTMDNKFGRLLIYQNSTHQLIEIYENPAGNLNPSTLTIHLVNFGLHDPQGMTFDPIHSTLYLLDAVGPQLVRIQSQSDGSFAGATALSVSLPWADNLNLRGIGFDPSSGNLQVVSPGEQKLYELTILGELVAIRDLSEFNLSNPQGMVFALSGDQTDDPSLLSLYLADNGLPTTSPVDQFLIENNTNKPSQGKIIELSLIQPIQHNIVASFTSTLVRTTDMAAYSPPSPDPSGLTYLSSRNTLLMSDGEVEETVSGITHFMGANLWEVTLGGTVVRTANISTVPPTQVPMTNEPAGVTWNPANGHYYFSDDHGFGVFDLNPGIDGLVGTADDSWTSFSTNFYGSGDPEGITFDSWNNTLFVSDGVNQEVYQYSLSGKLLNNFDVSVYGVVDPESVEFNPVSGTLFVLSNSGNRIIVETTFSGSLIQTIDVSANGSKAPAGLAYAPSSDGSGSRHFYIVDRGIDNNADPNIIDGKMYEMTAPVPIPPVNTPPIVNAGPDQTVLLDNGAVLNGGAIDDGLPTGLLTTRWSKVSGPSNVTFANQYALATTASFSSIGTYTLRLTANDSELSSYDEINITVTPYPTITSTPTQTANFTSTSTTTSTSTPTRTATSTSKPTRTARPTSTPTRTPTLTSTPTRTATFTSTPTKILLFLPLLLK